MCNIGPTGRAASVGNFDRSNSCVKLRHAILLTKEFGTVYQTAESECKHPVSPMCSGGYPRSSFTLAEVLGQH